MSEFSRRNVLGAAAAGGMLAAAGGTEALAQGQGQPWFGPTIPPLAAAPSTFRRENSVMQVSSFVIASFERGCIAPYGN